MKFLSKFFGEVEVSRFVYEATPEQGFLASDFKEKTSKSEKSEGFDATAIKDHTAKLNKKFGCIPRKTIKEAIQKSDTDTEGLDLIEDTKELERLEKLLESELSKCKKPEVKQAGEGKDKETPDGVEKIDSKADKKYEGLTGLTTAEVKIVKANTTKLVGELNSHFEGSDVSHELFDTAISSVLNGISKKDAMDRSFVMGKKGEIIKTINSKKTANNLENKIFDKLDKANLPGLSGDDIDPKMRKDAKDMVAEKLKALKGKIPTEADINKITEDISEAMEKKYRASKTKEKKESYRTEGFTKESVAASMVESNQHADNLRLVDNSKFKAENLKVGHTQKVDFKKNAENQRVVGASDLYPPEVRSITVTRPNGKSVAGSRQGVAGGFFTSSGEYVKILDKDSVKINAMAKGDNAEAKTLKGLKADLKTHVKEFKSEYAKLGIPDKDIEIAPGQKFKQSELIAQMSQRYGLDPHSLVHMSASIESKGTKYFTDLNMMARGMQKNMMKVGNGKVNMKDMYITKGGKRMIHPKYLNSLMGGQKDKVNSYIKSSGANYDGVKGADGKVMKHKDVVDRLTKGVDLGGGLSEADSQFLLSRMSGSTVNRVKALAPTAKKMAVDVLKKFPGLKLTSATREKSHNDNIKGASKTSDHQYGGAFDLGGSNGEMIRAQRYLQQKYGNKVWADRHGGTGWHLHVSWQPGGRKMRESHSKLHNATDVKKAADSGGNKPHKHT